jgi:cyanophycinase-like exopeptidase
VTEPRPALLSRPSIAEGVPVGGLSAGASIMSVVEKKYIIAVNAFWVFLSANPRREDSLKEGR